MAIAVLAALLIHVVWLARSYQHKNASTAASVRSAAAIGSWLITTALFCLIQVALHDLSASSKFYFGGDSTSKHEVSVVSSPENSTCYVEAKEPRNSDK